MSIDRRMLLLGVSTLAIVGASELCESESLDPNMENTKGPAVDTVLKFIELINHHSADKLAELMTEDHVFIDSLGQSVSGREQMRLGWQGYFAFCPDYWVSHEEALSSGNLVAVFGAAGGTIAADGKLPPENKWRTSAAWLAILDGGLVKQWRVYADNKPVYDIIARSKLKPGR
ncbi:MAG: nuclear transport factor 2 family protein [Steroidobacteraceae bacterium]|jgi:ketosteroid isomerase-like protein